MDIFCKIKDASIDPRTKELVNEICRAKVPIFENEAKTFAQEHKLSKEVREEISGLMIAAYFEGLADAIDGFRKQAAPDSSK
jgi:hypothetical protein